MVNDSNVMIMTKTLEEYKKYVKHRLEPISEILSNIAAGDFSKTLEIPYEEDEFTELYVGLSFMMEDLLEHLNEREQAEKELEQHKLQLEERVKERTKELRKVNKQLQLEIVERENAEKELRDSEEKYRLFFENISDVVFVVDSDFLLSYVSPTVEGLSGYKPDELIGRSFEELDFLTPESFGRALENMERILAGEEIGLSEVQFMTKDDVKTSVEVSYTPIFHGDEFNQLICVARDITERKLAEEALRESEEMYKTLVKTSPEAVTTSDLEGKITFVSPQTLKLHGYNTSEELLGKSAFELIHSSDHEIAMTNLQLTFTNGFVRNLEYKMLRKDGSIFPGELSAALIKDADGNPKSFIATTRDITERKKWEEQLKASLEEKETHLREIHHRVKNNIQVISSILNLYTGYIKNEKYIEMFREIQNRIRTMALIHEKLYLAKDTKQINFEEYIRELINNLFQFHEIKSTVIHTNIEAKKVYLGLDSAIPCGLIINELISNSFKHAFKGRTEGEVSIKLNLEKQKSDTNKISIIIGDNGVGFPKNIDFKKSRTFGLLLVNTLVDQLDGTIELNNSNGTEFEITFIEKLE
jgi:PAS domain S-box-containing protein